MPGIFEASMEELGVEKSRVKSTMLGRLYHDGKERVKYLRRDFGLGVGVLSPKSSSRQKRAYYGSP